MRALLRHFILEECEKHIRRHYDYLRDLQDAVTRKSKRTGTQATKRILVPDYWALDSRFNPFQTRIPRKLDLFSHAIADKLKAHTYAPGRALIHEVTRDDGSMRKANVFQLPDAALSRLVYKSLLRKNLSRLSGYAYAYREDRRAHDAVYNIHMEWRSLDRVYVAEFDFSKFFDNIEHDILFRVLDRHGFLYTNEERYVLEKFLASGSSTFNEYRLPPQSMRTKGIPQGTSISLFLANVACWELDRALERIGVRFGRYADDTILWSDSYARVVQGYEAIRKYGEAMGVSINVEKSEGIHIVSKSASEEMRSKPTVDFLGYELGLTKISIKASRVERIKRKISYLVYQNLLQEVKRGNFNRLRLANLDWDFVTALSQIRRYLYGGLNDDKLRDYILGITPALNFRGLMSYYPTINDRVQLKNLDGWLVYIIQQSLLLRQRLWQAHDGSLLPGPTPDWIEKLTELRAWSSAHGTIYDLRIPKFTLIQTAMSLAMSRIGIGAISANSRDYY